MGVAWIFRLHARARLCYVTGNSPPRALPLLLLTVLFALHTVQPTNAVVEEMAPDTGPRGGSSITAPGPTPKQIIAHWPPGKPLPPCPDWMAEYAAWHKTNKGKPGATYLVQYCANSASCPGMGDRVRGIMFLLRLASTYRKVLLVVWTKPEPIDDFMTPNLIDWSLDGLPQSVVDSVHSNTRGPFDMSTTKAGGAEETLSKLAAGTDAEAFAQAPIVRMQVNVPFSRAIEGLDDKEYLPPGPAQYSYGRCLVQMLFKPTPFLEQLASKRLERLYHGQPPKPFLAWHWRQGGMLKEPVLERHVYHSGYKELQYTRLRTVMSVGECANALAQQAGLPPLHVKPGLLVTDNSVVRGWVAGGELRSWVAHNTTVAHMKGAHMDEGAHQDMWVDVMMLAMADCFVMSSSGFTNTAFFFSNTTCFMRMLTCQTDDEPRFEGIEV